MNRLTYWFLLMGLCLIGRGQNAFSLSFGNTTYSPVSDTLTTEVMLSLDVEGRLGSANLVFTYDTSALKLLSFAPEGNNSDYQFSLTSSRAGRGSYNIALLNPGAGDSILAHPQRQKLATLMWEVRDPSGGVAINWHEEGTQGTVVFIDDEVTPLASDTLISYQESGSAFPIEWGPFTATQWGDRVKLNWTTLQEANNSVFWIDRSLDARSFERIGSTPSQGDSERPQHYEWIDRGATALGMGQPIHYRLVQVDFDGASSRSQVRSVTLDATGLSFVHVYPSEVEKDGSLTVEVNLPETTQAQLVLYNALGQSISEQTVEVEAQQTQTLQFSLPSVPAGFYTLSVVGPHEIYASTRLKVR